MVTCQVNSGSLLPRETAEILAKARRCLLAIGRHFFGFNLVAPCLLMLK